MIIEPFGLYLVLTDPVAGYERCTEAAVDSGVRFVQLRMKESPREDVLRMGRRVRDIVAGSGTLLILNDDPSMARIVGADGAHVGQDDLPVPQARELLAEGMVIGLSTHNEEQAERAQALGPDYIGVGPIFRTPTKAIPDPVLGLDRAADIVAGSRVPAVGIGGIDAERLPELLGRGILNFAVVRYVCTAARPRSAIGELVGIWKGTVDGA